MKLIGACVFAVLLSASLASATWVDHGTVTTVIPGRGAGGNIVSFSTTAHQGGTGCGGTGDYAVDVGTPGGRAQYAAILAAGMGGKAISVLGGATCILPDAESVANLVVYP